MSSYFNMHTILLQPLSYSCCFYSRIPLCKALGLRVTATVFTAGASQVLAKKAGFLDLFEMSYKQLAEQGCIFPGVEQDTKSSKLMALVIE